MNRSARRELTDAVDARARGLQLRQIRAGRSSTRDPNRPDHRIETEGPTMQKRIAKREALSVAAIRELEAQARVLVAGRSELARTLHALRRVKRTIIEHAATHHVAHDLPAHRPGDVERQFRADVQRTMTRHGLGPTDAASIIVRHVARLPKAARTALFGSLFDRCRTERERTKHLADLLRKPV